MRSSKAICDTVALKICKDDFKITKPDLFNPSATTVLNYRGKGTIQAFQTMTAQDKLNHKYKPKLAIKREQRVGGYENSLYIELSLPKLIYGNNLQEVCDDDFSKILHKLKEILEQMGVIVELNTLRFAHVCRFHSCKNVILPDGLSTVFIVSELAKEYIGHQFDNGQTNYKNGGHCIRFHTNEYEIAAYDKMMDIKQLKKSAKRCTDDESHRDFQNIDISQFGNLQVFRLENRLNTAKVIRRKLKEAGVNYDESKDLTFDFMYDSDISQKLNCYFWKRMINAGSLIFRLNENSKTIWGKLCNSLKQIKLLAVIGLWQLIRDCGMPYVRNILNKTPTIRNLFKILKDYQDDDDWKEKIFEQIGKAIEENKVIQLPTSKTEGYKNKLEVE